MDHLTQVSTRNTPQNRRAEPNQVKNNAGGYTFEVTDLERLRRFLILGVGEGTYYVNASDHAAENGEFIIELAKNKHEELVKEIVDVSVGGRAPKNQPALFALAVACSFGTADERKTALNLLPAIARTGTHLFTFVNYVEQFRGWGRSLRQGVSNWYSSKTADRLAYQLVKYRQRNGWSHRDVLRLAHPTGKDQPEHSSLYNWVTKGVTDENSPSLLEGFLKANEPGADVAQVALEYGLTWEMLPTESLNDRKVWQSLLASGVPLNALVRQLPRLTRLGFFEPFSEWIDVVASRLTDHQQLRKARVHPVNQLVAYRTYQGGQSLKGGTSWVPSQKIVDVLEQSFYESFDVVTPANKRTLVALDVSGSMGYPNVPGLPLTPREVSAAMAMTHVRTEPECEVFAFTSQRGGLFDHNQLTPLDVTPRTNLGEAVKRTQALRFGRTDCALPVLGASQNRWTVDTFVIYTDNETWVGKVHPHQALQQYRQKTGIDSKLVTCATTSTGFSIADPKDAGMLDVVGFDSSTPSLVSEFSKGF